MMRRAQLRLLGVPDLGERDHPVDVELAGVGDLLAVVVRDLQAAGKLAAGRDGRGLDRLGEPATATRSSPRTECPMPRSAEPDTQGRATSTRSRPDPALKPTEQRFNGPTQRKSACT
ncbi:hypothetical protein GCM10010222_80300 [Streptomyces tanashiensis]|nr:hypothetical protein GCM10010222_80300 [Streptomyces tanashiensis]